MNDEKKTKKQLIEELVLLRREISKLKVSKARGSGIRAGKQDTKWGQHSYPGLLMKTLATMPEAVFIIGPDTEILDCNAAASRIFGYSRHEMVGRNVGFLHVSDVSRKEFAGQLDRSMAANGFFALPEFRMKRKKGEIFATEHVVTALEDERGVRVGWLSVVRDISKRKQMEQATERLSHQLSLILQTLPVACFVAKAEGDYAATFVTENIKVMTGFEAQNLISDPSFWKERIHLEDRSRIFSDLSEISETRTHQSEYRWRVANDTYRWFHEYHRLMKSSDGVNCVVGVVQDITVRKQAEEALQQSEQRYRALAESAQDYIFVVDKDGYVKYVNAFAANEFGCRPEEMVGKQMHEFFPPEIAERQLKNIREVLKSGRRVLNDMLQVFPNRTVWIDTSLVPLGNEVDEPDSVIGISRDITRRKEAEEALQKNEELDKKLAQENSTIAEIGRVISSTLNIEEVYDRFAEVVQKLLPFDRITISLNNVEDKTVRIAYLTGMHIETVSVGTIIPLAESLNEQLLEKRAAIAIQIESEEGALKPSIRTLAYCRAGIRSMISAPLISKGEVIGGLHIGSVEPNAYTQEDLNMAERIALQISGAVANGELFSRPQEDGGNARRKRGDDIVCWLGMPWKGFVWHRTDGSSLSTPDWKKPPVTLRRS